jgi:NitT/TauT family transport system substrate-binding protein
MTHHHSILRRTWLAWVVALLVAGASIGAASAQDASPSAAPSVAPAQPPALAAPTDLAPPEQTSISVGYRLPNLNSRAPFLVALDRGYFEEAGLEAVELIQTEDALAGLVGGSLDIANVETLDAANGVVEGLPIEAIGGYQNYSVNLIAVRPEIETPQDLEGKDILLGGTPGSLDFDFRMKLLKEAGFDISGVNVNPVTIEGGSNAWVEHFLNGNLYMTPIFNRHRALVEEAGGRLVVDNFLYGSDLLAANRDWAAANPATVRAFLSAYIRALADVQDPANADHVLSLGEREGITITPGVRSGWPLDVLFYQPFDGGFGDRAQGHGLGELQAYLTENLPAVPDMATFIDAEDLNAAQQALGLEPNPVMGEPAG